MYWLHVMQWTADYSSAKHSAEFVCICLQTWIPNYQWKNVNPALASLGQLMALKKNASKIEQVAMYPQYMYIKDKILTMLCFYLKKKAHEDDVDENDIGELP